MREIVKQSLYEYHGNRFDYTIDQLSIIRDDFRGKLCYYHKSNNDDDLQYILISFDNNEIDINTNLLYLKWFTYTHNRKFNHYSDNENDYDIEFNLKTKYNKSLSDVLSIVREVRLQSVLDPML